MTQPDEHTNTHSLSYLRPEVAALKDRLDVFVRDECIPAEADYLHHVAQFHGQDRWTVDAIPPCLKQLQERAKTLGLWNLFLPRHLLDKLPDPSLGPSIVLTYREYGILCESLGRCPLLAPQACNTSAPDTGNMEVLLEFGTPQQQQRYLVPLLRGEMRSAFLMTEPHVASSDPTNLQTSLRKKQSRRTRPLHYDDNYYSTNDHDEYELTGEKWWSTGAMDPRCRMALVVAKMVDNQTNNNTTTTTTTTTEKKKNKNRHDSHTIVIVDLPHPSIRMVRPLTVFGYDDAPHGHAQVVLDKVPLTKDALVAGEGMGFAISQARLGPGRIHHCMRAIGIGTDPPFFFRERKKPTCLVSLVVSSPPYCSLFSFITFVTAQRCYELMLQRSMERETFGKKLWQHGGCQELIADSAADLESARLLTLSCAAAMDHVGAKRARDKIAMIKVRVPELTYRVVDRALQVFGGAGFCEDYPLASALAALRTLRVADGPDAVHKRTAARIEIQKSKKRMVQSRL